MKPYFETESRQIYCGHVLEVLKGMDSESIDCIMTSPPYWGLRDYGAEPVIWDGDPDCEHEWGDSMPSRGQSNWHTFEHKYHSPGSHKTTIGSKMKHTDLNQNEGSGQFCQRCNAWKGSLGLEPTFQLYIDHMVQIFNEIKRVLRKDGTCWVNMGDTYGYQSGNNAFDGAGLKKAYQNTQNRMKVKRTNIQNKSLCQIPQRFSIAMTDNGWILRNVIIWYKRNCMPSSASDRFTVDFEYLYFFVKNKKYWFEQQYDVYDKPLDRWGGNNLKADGQSTWDEGTGQEIYRDRNMRPNSQGRNKRTVWDIPTQPFPEAHFAVYPEQLCEIPLIAGCPRGGTVLDPFMGAGTTLLKAEKLGLNWIGIDIVKDYADMTIKRLGPELAQNKMDFEACK